MVASCTYFLNNKAVSTLTCDGSSYAAFSGAKGYENNPADQGIENLGPIPKGTYYIIDRQSGGHLGWLWDAVKNHWSDSDHNSWFALHPMTRPQDDFVYVSRARRAHLRIHPVGRHGISEGCITLTSVQQFEKLRAYLKSQKTKTIPGTVTQYYGTVEVK